MSSAIAVDVLVAGGGPAGSTVATLLARAGHRVLLAERSAEPTFRIGESLMPATYEIFARLGVLDQMRASRFPAKYSVQFFSGSGRGSAPFYFYETDDHERSQTWQVLRSEFDPMLRANAVASGVDLRTGAAVREVRFEGQRATGARLTTAEGELEVTARVVVDATGQSALLARRLGLRDTHQSLRNVSFFTHFEGARLDEGIDAGATLIFHTEGNRSWMWLIPLPEGRVSVGVVGPVDELVRGRAGDPQTVFDEELARCPGLVPRLEGARQVLPMHGLRDFSYRCREAAGDGWVLVGDAYGFIDPIYSTGVFLALKSGEMAADAIDSALREGDTSGAALGRFAPTLSEGMRALEQLVLAYYDPEFSFGAFLREYPDRRQDVVDMLVGRVFEVSPAGLLTDLEAFVRALRVERAS